MGFRIMQNLPEGYGPRDGLEGPFNYDGHPLYYSVTEGKYYDPTQDMFLSYDEYRERFSN